MTFGTDFTFYSGTDIILTSDRTIILLPFFDLKTSTPIILLLKLYLPRIRFDELAIVFLLFVFL